MVLRLEQTEKQLGSIQVGQYKRVVQQLLETCCSTAVGNCCAMLVQTCDFKGNVKHSTLLTASSLCIYNWVGRKVFSVFTNRWHYFFFERWIPFKTNYNW